MCGIAGFLALDGRAQGPNAGFSAMLESLRRRGPDQSGEYFDGPVALVHARLSVVDLELGRQPMRLTQGREAYALVYNGELYNTEELRRELLALGHRFAGHSDTEVLLHAYAEWKEQCVHRLNGIFAFAVWEERARRLFIARDRIGVKPFFYALRKEGFVFGSEIKALLASSFVEPVIGRNSIAELLFLGPGRTPGCGVFRGVEELKPGFCGFVDESGPRLWRYWRLADAEHRGSFAQTAERVRELVIDAVKRQLVADVPLGTFLSGGLDSSLISAIAAAEFKKRGERLKTFSVDYVGNEQYFTASHFQPNSDRDFIGKMNDFLGAEAHIVTLNNEELARALYAAVEARDLPGMADVDASLLLFCEKIKEEVTVALSGECADEIFGGYPWYRDKNILKKEGFPWAQSTAYRAGFLREEITAELDGPAFVTERYRQSLADCSIMPDSPPEERRMKEMVNLNFDWFMQTLLDRKDRMSMFSGLEVRVPFCDYRIAETLYAVPWGMKNDQGREKGLLREAMRGLLPDEILWRKKSPYPKTHNPAYLRAVSAMLREVTANPDSPLLQIVKKEALEALLRAENPTPWYGQLMTTPQTIAYFVQMDYWMRKYKVCLA